MKESHRMTELDTIEILDRIEGLRNQLSVFSESALFEIEQLKLKLQKIYVEVIPPCGVPK
jgi:hypothetical protein